MSAQSSKDLVAKRLRTGEIAVWDPESRSVILIAHHKEGGTPSVRLIRGAELKALEEALGQVIVLV